MSKSSIAIRPTPPVIKWLLNERAMLLGEISRREKWLMALTSELGDMRQRMNALDIAVGLADETVNPAAAGAMHVNLVNYGGKGELSKFLFDEVKKADLTGVSATDLAMRAACRFHVPIDSKSALLKYLRNSVGFALRTLRAQGQIEPLFASRGGQKPSIWRVSAPVSAFEALMRQRDNIEGSSHG